MAEKKSETRNTASVLKQVPNTQGSRERLLNMTVRIKRFFLMQSAFWSDKTTLKKQLNDEKEM